MSDIGIVGGGLTGVMMAIALSHCGPSITLIRQAPAAAKRRQSDNRTTTVHAAGKSMLDVLGVWSCLQTPPTPITRIMIAEGASRAGTRAHQRTDFGLTWHDADQPMAYVVDNGALLDALEEVLAQRPVSLIQPATVTKLETIAGKARLVCNHAAVPDFDLVVACDGAHSQLRVASRVRHFTAAHRQTAMAAMVALERDHDNTAFQRFLPDGPLALMPFGERLASLVWTMPKAAAASLAAVDDADFDRACNAAFGPQLGYMRVVGRRDMWPLQPSWMPKLGTDNLIFAGDAGHHIHPLAGQGYNLALGDAAILADCVSAAQKRGLPAGHTSVQKAYQRGRQGEVAAMTAMTSGLNMMMSYAPNKIAKLAGIGMSMVNASPLKNLFQSIASGGVLSRANLLEGRLPD